MWQNCLSHFRVSTPSSCFIKSRNKNKQFLSNFSDFSFQKKWISSSPKLFNGNKSNKPTFPEEWVKLSKGTNVESLIWEASEVKFFFFLFNSKQK